MSVVAWIALGSNLGDRRAALDGAVAALAAADGVVVEQVSRWIETAPVGGPAGQPAFLNGVLRCRTRLSARELLELLQRIEARFGRERGVPDGPRTLDLDLLVHGDARIDEPGLVVPHPRQEDRLFVLEPLAELDPEHRLAGCGLTVRERLAELRA